MYKQRNNFSILEIPSANKKRLLAKEILESIITETLNINDLNSLYQNKERKQTQEQPATVSTVPNTSELKFNTLAAPQNTEALLKKTYDDTLLLGISKPFKIVFTDLQANEVTQPEEAMEEEVQLLDDEVLIPMKAREKEIEKEDEEDAKDSDEETKELPKKEEGDVDYDFLVLLPASEVLPKDIIDAVNKAGQGMISNPVLKKMTEIPIGIAKPISRIQSIEDDPDGFSTCGMDGDLALKLLKTPNKK